MRTGRRRRVSTGGTRQLIDTGSRSGVAVLDDVPLEITPSRDGKRLFVILPYEIWILDSRSLAVQRTIELAAPHPCITEDVDGVLWVGGQHLFRGSSWASTTEKVGSKLGGFVDRVVLLRPGLLCGVGRHGEILWDTEASKLLHRRKARGHDVHGLLATADERALWCDGGPASWLINPARMSGYTQVRFPTTSRDPVEEEGIVAIGMTTRGVCILGARDGGLAWTHGDLRLAGERFPRCAGDDRWPLAVCGDEDWIYVLRRRGLLHRFRIEEPRKQAASKDDKSDARKESARRQAAEEEPPPAPPAQSCRLDAPASCLAMGPGERPKLLVGGPRSDGHLGKIWVVDPAELEWKKLAFSARELVEPPPEPVTVAPSFVPTRSKLEGPSVRDLKVDDVISGKIGFFVTRDHGNVLEQPAMRMSAESVLPGDALLLPAMLRLSEGKARPGLLLWSSTRTRQDEPAALRWLTWGDQPTGWLMLEPPQLREQGWSRTNVFPLGAALPSAPPNVAGERRLVPPKWVDEELFAALARECKKLLVVLW